MRGAKQAPSLLTKKTGLGLHIGAFFPANRRTAENGRNVAKGTNDTNDYRVAIYPGDGIGIDVTVEAVKSMNAAAERYGFTLEMTEFDWGHRHWPGKNRATSTSLSFAKTPRASTWTQGVP